MSAHIPGTTPDFMRATDKTEELVSKILLATGDIPAMAYTNGTKIAGYAGEIILVALASAGLLSPDFTPEKLNVAVQEIDSLMNLDPMIEQMAARE